MQIVKQLLLNEDDELNNNFMFLPFSIHTPLSIVASGMKDPTSERLLFLLGFKSLDDLQAKVNDPQLMAIFASSDQKNAKGPTICSVHGSRIDKKYTFNHSFHQLPQTLYKADSSTVDFENKTREVISKINTWVEKIITGLIRNMLTHDPQHKETALILHSSCIAVDEYGTETVAATYEDNMTISMERPPPLIDFMVDHPFIFMIREDISKTPIFLGVVVKTWAKLLNTFCSSWKLEMELIYKVQMQCYEDAKLMKLFPEMIRSLYEQKVLAEEAIIHWFHRGTNPKGRQNFVKALKPFVDWLKEA